MIENWRELVGYHAKTELVIEGKVFNQNYSMK